MRNLAASLLVLAFAAELVVRLTGTVDIPRYRPDSAYGYIPQASQRGSFRNRNAWVYNERSMGVSEPFRPGGVLLIGDSIVNGGNPIGQADRLGPQISNLIHQPVWPVSAGSWSLLNELAWMEKNPDVVRGVDQIIIVLNSADFMEPSVWSKSPNLLDHKPICGLCYLADRFLLSRFVKPPPTKVTGRDWREELAALRQRTNKPVTIVLYPRQGETLAMPLAGLVVSEDSRWRKATYRDPMHVDARGTKILAQVIADHL